MNSVGSPPFVFKTLSNNFEHDDIVTIDLLVPFPQPLGRRTKKGSYAAKPTRQRSSHCIEVFGRKGLLLVIVERQKQLDQVHRNPRNYSTLAPRSVAIALAFSSTSPSIVSSPASQLRISSIGLPSASASFSSLPSNALSRSLRRSCAASS